MLLLLLVPALCIGAGPLAGKPHGSHLEEQADNEVVIATGEVQNDPVDLIPIPPPDMSLLQQETQPNPAPQVD